jgi:hypothetical protein
MDRSKVGSFGILNSSGGPLSLLSRLVAVQVLNLDTVCIEHLHHSSTIPAPSQILEVCFVSRIKDCVIVIFLFISIYTAKKFSRE